LALSQAEFNRLVTDHGPALYRMAYRMVGNRHEAEDVVQDTFRSAWKSRASYHEGLRGPGSVRPPEIVATGDESHGDDVPGDDTTSDDILADEALVDGKQVPAPELAVADEERPVAHGERAWLASILRRRVVDRWRKKSWPTLVSGQTTIEESVDGVDPLANDFTDEMQNALDRLTPDLKEALLLVVVGELTHQETADLLRIPLGTVLSRVSRARQRLRELLMNSARSSAG
jgi:DNA-directed RNA polymerase specialized sigma24 family protein